MINVIIPMCGQSQRFRDAGYTIPKFLLDVDGVPMFVAAVRSLKLTVKHQHYFVVLESVEEEYNLTETIKQYFPDAGVIILKEPTGGMAETVYKTQPYVDADAGSLLVCCDQLVEYDSKRYNDMLENPHIAGSLLCFHDTERDPKWTYIRRDVIEQVVNVGCKIPFSDWPIVGTYHWSNTKWMFRDLAGLLKDERNRVNGEFYVCSAAAVSVAHANRPWKSFAVDKMIPLGTAEDYEAYINDKNNNI